MEYTRPVTGTQHVHQRFRRPFGRVAAENIGHLAGGGELGHRRGVAEQLGDIHVRVFGDLHQQRTRDARELALVAQPLEQRVRLAVVRDRRARASSLVAFSTASMAGSGLRCTMPSASPALYRLPEARERELHVAHFAQRAAAHDALVGQHFGGGGIRARQFDDGGGRRGGLSDTGGNARRRRQLVP